jgi:hypothetical protein
MTRRLLGLIVGGLLLWSCGPVAAPPAGPAQSSAAAPAAPRAPAPSATDRQRLIEGARGIPARFVSLDFAYNSDTHVVVPRKVAHPNAAKLVAAVMAGPEGQRIADEQLGVGNRYYENSLEYGLEEEARAAGLSSFSWADAPREVLDLLFSPQAPELEREIDTILKGAY